MTCHRYPVAVHLFFIRDDHVLLLRRRNTGWRDGEYSVPAGHVEPGETVTEAACREAQEEIGLALDRKALDVVHVMHRAAETPADDERIDFFLAVKTWPGEPVNAEPEKCDDLRWFPRAALPANVIPYVAHALRCHAQGERFSEFGWSG